MAVSLTNGNTCYGQIRASCLRVMCEVSLRDTVGEETVCCNGWWRGFHPTHWGLFVVILGALVGAIWASSRQTGLISARAQRAHACWEGAHEHTPTGTCTYKNNNNYMRTDVSIKLAAFLQVFVHMENPFILSNEDIIRIFPEQNNYSSHVLYYNLFWSNGGRKKRRWK